MCSGRDGKLSRGLQSCRQECIFIPANSGQKRFTACAIIEGMTKTKQFYRTIGRKGGLKGGLAKVRKGFGWLTPAERREMARAAARKRWALAKAAKEAK
jgi:hypothetical protein